MSEFKYLGSVVEVHGEVLKDVESRFVKASVAIADLFSRIAVCPERLREKEREIYC